MMIWAKKKSPHFREKYLVLSYLKKRSHVFHWVDWLDHIDWSRRWSKLTTWTEWDKNNLSNWRHSQVLTRRWAPWNTRGWDMDKKHTNTSKTTIPEVYMFHFFGLDPPIYTFPRATSSFFWSSSFCQFGFIKGKELYSHKSKRRTWKHNQQCKNKHNHRVMT